MKRLFALVAVLCFPLAMTAQDKDQDDKDHSRFNHERDKDKGDKDDKDHFRFLQEGEFASLSGSAPDGGVFSFQVSRGSNTTGGTSASLQYSAFFEAPDFSSITITNVFGTTFIPTCGSGPSGLIHLEFSENGAQRTIVDLRQTTFSGPVTTRLHQMSDNSTADVTGILFGNAVSALTGVNATVGVNHQSTLEIVHD